MVAMIKMTTKISTNKTTILQFRDPQLVTDGSVVGFYEREFYMFSNFSSFQVEWRGRLWPTSEHAYQAAKYLDHDEEYAEKIYQARSAHQAYKLAKSDEGRSRRRPDWSEIKDEIMLDICRHKLEQHEYIRDKLLATNDELLVEDSPKDDYWGWGSDRRGRNQLGKTWMKLREELGSGKL